jgi:hypothetical protein
MRTLGRILAVVVALSLITVYVVRAQWLQGQRVKEGATDTTKTQRSSPPDSRAVQAQPHAQGQAATPMSSPRIGPGRVAEYATEGKPNAFGRPPAAVSPEVFIYSSKSAAPLITVPSSVSEARRSGAAPAVLPGSKSAPMVSRDFFSANKTNQAKAVVPLKPAPAQAKPGT